MPDRLALVAVKTLHTLVWAFFVACIVGAPLAAARGRFGLAGLLIGLVLLEGIVLAVNRWTCPLTGVAARYTRERAPNFDIYLPRWLARHNKAIFTPLYLLGCLYVLAAWWRHG
ncbi:MAG: hypothetical protein JNM90_12060 [Burkholderiales bacterium]|nr:hypothetical protein [Burkholderiales bacterium]